MTANYLTTKELEATLVEVLASPQEIGRVEALVIRPAPGERRQHQAARLSPEEGMAGDRWARAVLSPDPHDQISLMNVRLLRALAGGDPERMALAGDNLVVDLDLTEANLPPGQKLWAGEALLEITDKPHTGCGQFSARFGPDAVRFINAAEHKTLHLRGIYARVVQAGTIRVGDALRVCKVE